MPGYTVTLTREAEDGTVTGEMEVQGDVICHGPGPDLEVLSIRETYNGQTLARSHPNYTEAEEAILDAAYSDECWTERGTLANYDEDYGSER